MGYFDIFLMALLKKYSKDRQEYFFCTFMEADIYKSIKLIFKKNNYFYFSLFIQ